MTDFKQHDDSVQKFNERISCLVSVEFSAGTVSEGHIGCFFPLLGILLSIPVAGMA